MCAAPEHQSIRRHCKEKHTRTHTHTHTLSLSSLSSSPPLLPSAPPSFPSLSPDCPRPCPPSIPWPCSHTGHSNECKRRKIKCNGQTPCERCGHLNLQCLYAPNCCSNFKDSEEFKQLSDQVRRLQEHVDSLVNGMNSLRQETLRLAPLHDRVLPPPSATTTTTVTAAASSSPAASSALPPLAKASPLSIRVPSPFRGPTSIAFTVDVAKNTLHNMGYPGVRDAHEDGGAQPESTPHASPLLAPAAAAQPLAQSAADPIWEFDEAEMVRLCKLHEEEIGIMYPIMSIDTAIEHARHLAAWMDSARRNALGPPPHAQHHDVLSDHKTLVLKLILCCALVIEEHGNSARARRMFDTIQPIVDRMLMSEPANVSNLPFLGLVAGYRFLSNEEILGWRVVGQVARLCLELGLHRREGLQQIADPQVRRDALHTFWSAYVLDRRWSFATGLPFVCHDDKIDPNLPYPENSLFLIAMIGYSRVAAKIWRLVDYFEPAVVRELKPRDFEELDREIMEWYDSIPEDIKMGPLDADNMTMPAGPLFDIQRLRIWTRLRLNQVSLFSLFLLLSWPPV